MAPSPFYPFSRGGQGQAVEIITDEIENFVWALIHLLMARDDDEETALSWNMFNEVFMICYPRPLHSDSPTNPAVYQD